MARKLTDTVRINLRFSEALRRRIERVATANKRSINDEIVSRVDASFAREELEASIEAAVERVLVKAGKLMLEGGVVSVSERGTGQEVPPGGPPGAPSKPEGSDK
jgi:hypothetical protein